MKIGIYVGKMFKSTVGGGHIFEANFIDSLLNLETPHEIVVYYLSNKDLYVDTDRVKFVNLAKKACGLNFLPFIKKNIFNWTVKKDNIDLVYYCTPKYAYTELPYVFTLWDLGHRVMPLFPEVSLKHQYEKREINFTQPLQKASMIFVGNNEGKNNICTFYNVEPDKVKIVEMPTPRDIFNIKPDEKILNKLNLKQGEYVYYPAQFWAHKNHIRIVKAIKVLKDRGINFKAVFSGADKFNQKYIEEEVKNLGISENIIFAGFITREELVALYQNAHSLVYASLLGPDNIPPLEAMALGCPVIISDLKGHIDQLGDNVTYFEALNEYDLADKIENLNRLQMTDKLENAKKIATERNSDNYVRSVFVNINSLTRYFECWKK